MNAFQRWSQKEYPLGRRLLATIPAGILLVGLIPCGLLWGMPRVDGWLGWPQLLPGWPGLAAGLALLVGGLPLALWTVIDQFDRARGTPLPMMPTQRLLTDGPYTWSRNPMVFGTLCAYLGVALLARSWSALLVVLFFGTGLLIYVKALEEHELAQRFGQAYLDYRARTSFLVPWPPRKR